MKVVKGLAILCFFSVILGSCFDPPEFPNTPEITFEDIRFIDVANISAPDTLVVKIRFKDGDGDLGIDPQNPQFSDPPYQYADYFQATGNGNFNTITSNAGVLSANNTQTIIDVLNIENPAAGKLVYPRTRKQSGYATLPDYSCVNYEYKEFVIEANDLAALGTTASIRDTVSNGAYFIVQDTLYVKPNPNHYNIEVDFFVKVSQNEFQEFDWREEFCTTFDGRFGILSDNPRAMDGTLSYSMTSVGFKELFGGKTIKLRIKIRDQALNESNEVETREFQII
jgi:hypothetical protein